MSSSPWTSIHILTFPFRGFLRNVLKLSDSGSYILVSGLLCGYPMGARNCSDFLDGERITKAEARYLLSICNHPSPMFLLGYAASELPGAVPVWLLMVSVYLPVFILAGLSRKVYGIQAVSPSLPYAREAQLTFDESLMDSCEVMVKIGGYIMLFSILVFILRDFRSIIRPEKRLCWALWRSQPESAPSPGQFLPWQAACGSPPLPHLADCQESFRQRAS